MKRLKQWVSKLSGKKKLIFYGYLIITPVLVAVCIVLVIYNYNNQINKVLEKDISGINTLSESINVLQTEYDKTDFLSLSDKFIEFCVVFVVNCRKLAFNFFFTATAIVTHFIKAGVEITQLCINKA